MSFGQSHGAAPLEVPGNGSSYWGPRKSNNKSCELQPEFRWDIGACMLVLPHIHSIAAKLDQ